MGISTESLPQGRLDAIITGIEQEQEAFADKVCRSIPSDDLDGSVTLFETAAVMRQSSDGDRRKLDPGAQGDELHLPSGSLSYDAGRYGTWMPVTKEDIIRHDSINESATGRAFKELIKQAHVDLDVDLANLLVDPNANETVSAANPWEDKTNGTPVEDIEAAYDKVPGATDLILGKQDIRDLKHHPAIDPKSDNYDRDNTDVQGIEEFLLSQFEDEGLEKVHYFTKKERTSNSGQATTKGYIHPSGPWLGYKENLVLINPDHNENPDRGEDIEGPKSAHRLWYYRFADLQRPLQDTGCVIQSV